jgi:hypothetical protein
MLNLLPELLNITREGAVQCDYIHCFLLHVYAPLG